MDKNILKKLITILFILFILVTLYKIFEKEESKHFNKIQLSTDNNINNRTDVDYLDTIVSVGLKKLAIKDLTVIILPLTENQKHLLGSGFELRAHVRGVGSYYYIWIDKMSKDEYLNVLSHELIHVKQYANKQIVYDDTKVLWNNIEYDLSSTDYDLRPWEIEAYAQQDKLMNLIKLELYD